jgi:hypothetical protein
MRIFNDKGRYIFGELHILISMEVLVVVHCGLVSDQPCHKEGCLNLVIQAIGG